MNNKRGNMEYTLYHGTNIENAKKIIENDFIPSCSDPFNKHWHWLGDGIYFYDELESSKKWAKRNSFNKEGFSVIECLICVDKNCILDFHSKRDADNFYEKSKGLLKEYNLLVENIDEEDIVKRKVFYTMIMTYCEVEKIYLIIASVNRHPSNEKNLWFQSLGLVTDFEKQYCLREKSCIKTKKICYNNIKFIEII